MIIINMEEEKKETIDNEQLEPVQSEAPIAQENKSNEMDPDDKNTLISFILACAAVTVCAGWIIGGVAAVVLGCISLKYQALGHGGKNKPYTIFSKIAYPLAIVMIVLGAIVAVLYFILLIVNAFNAA